MSDQLPLEEKIPKLNMPQRKKSTLCYWKWQLIKHPYATEDTHIYIYRHTQFPPVDFGSKPMCTFA
jgi:hypothetical protein